MFNINETVKNMNRKIELKMIVTILYKIQKNEF